jgi:hypothetical protein
MIDWGAAATDAVRRLRRESQRERGYLRFSYPEPRAGGGDGTSPRSPFERPSPGRGGRLDGTASGERLDWTSDYCNMVLHGPGSEIGNMYRFTGGGARCENPGRPAGPRDDLFEELKPDYLR